MDARTTSEKVRQGTPAWFEIVGTFMTDAAARSGLPADQNIALVERYTDGIEQSVDCSKAFALRLPTGSRLSGSASGGTSGLTSLSR